MPRLPVASVLCALALVGCKESASDGGGGDESADPKEAQDGGKGGKGGVSGLAIDKKCDEAKLLALSGTLKSKDVREHATLVATTLPDACELPPAVTSFLAMPRSPHEATDAPLDPDAAKHAHEAFTEVCAAADVVAPAIAKIAADERMPLVYDKCKYERFGLMDRDAYLRGKPSSPVPWFAYDWLQRQGYSQEDVKLIGRALIYRDRTLMTVPDQTLVGVASKLPAIPDGIAVHLSRRDVMFADRSVASLDGEGAVEEHAVMGHLIGPLYDELAEEADKGKAIADASGREWGATLVLVADAGTPFGTIVDTMYTAGRAEYRNYAFVAETGPAEYGAIPIEPPKFHPVGGKVPTGKGPSMRLVITEEGFTIPKEGEEGALTKIPRIEGKSGVEAYDFAKLTAAAVAHRDEHTATGAIVTAETTIPYDVFVRALAAVRGDGCGVGGATCVLPELVVEAGASTTGGGLYAMKGPAGVLGTMAGESGHFLASPYGAAFAVGEDDEDVWGGLTGTEVGEAFGVGGLGLVGTGRGGGGTEEGTIGLGTTGLIGKGGGGGTGSGYGRGSGAGFGGRGKRVPRVRQAKASVSGALDKDIIRRIVRAHINEVRYCYNQGLTKDEELKGRVAISFEIGATGKVSDSEVSTTSVSDKAVGTCIAKAVKRWKFPRPTDGGTVSVVYPFVLSPG